MTIIMFLIDSSASMTQRCYLGTSYLDVARNSVENFMKLRSRDPQSKFDRYMLLNFDPVPTNIKAGWKENIATFMTELKCLTSTEYTCLGSALRGAFDLLNLNRMISGIDCYGQGRFPFYIEPAIIICFTDGGELSAKGIHYPELELPGSSTLPGADLTAEPFRWDQRLFGVVLRLPGHPASIELTSNGSLDCDDGLQYARGFPVDLMCEVTGGRTILVKDHVNLARALEFLVQKTTPGVILNFEKYTSDSSDVDANTASQQWERCKRMIYVPKPPIPRGGYQGHWPIPESFWPDLASPSLPPRIAHPTVSFSWTTAEPLLLENFPFDKYELEPSPLTQRILQMKQPNLCWQVFVRGSGKYSEFPFGYLKANTSLTAVNLVVHPYNYPTLLPLVDELVKVHKTKPTDKWKASFLNYLSTVPPYYLSPLKRALEKLNCAALIHEDSCYSYQVHNSLKQLKLKARAEYERLVAAIGGQRRLRAAPTVSVAGRNSAAHVLYRPDVQTAVEKRHGSLDALGNVIFTPDTAFRFCPPAAQLLRNPLRNVFDVDRDSLLVTLTKMKASLLSFDDADIGSGGAGDYFDENHIPIGQMGNYQQYQRRQPTPLRDVEERAPRLHTFGNPFKANKNLSMIDETDLPAPSPNTSAPQQPAQSKRSPRPFGAPFRKRRPGPLPRDFSYSVYRQRRLDGSLQTENGNGAAGDTDMDGDFDGLVVIDAMSPRSTDGSVADDSEFPCDVTDDDNQFGRPLPADNDQYSPLDALSLFDNEQPPELSTEPSNGNTSDDVSTNAEQPIGEPAANGRAPPAAWERIGAAAKEAGLGGARLLKQLVGECAFGRRHAEQERRIKELVAHGPDELVDLAALEWRRFKLSRGFLAELMALRRRPLTPAPLPPPAAPSPVNGLLSHKRSSPLPDGPAASKRPRIEHAPAPAPAPLPSLPSPAQLKLSALAAHRPAPVLASPAVRSNAPSRAFIDLQQKFTNSFANLR